MTSELQIRDPESRCPKAKYQCSVPSVLRTTTERILLSSCLSFDGGGCTAGAVDPCHGLSYLILFGFVNGRRLPIVVIIRRLSFLYFLSSPWRSPCLALSSSWRLIRPYRLGSFPVRQWRGRPWPPSKLVWVSFMERRRDLPWRVPKPFMKHLDLNWRLNP